MAADRFADVTASMMAGDLDPYQAADQLLAAVLAAPGGPRSDG